MCGAAEKKCEGSTKCNHIGSRKERIGRVTKYRQARGVYIYHNHSLIMPFRAFIHDN